MPQVRVRDVLGLRPPIERSLGEDDSAADLRALVVEHWAAPSVLFLDSRPLDDETELQSLCSGDTLVVDAVALSESAASPAFLDSVSREAAERWLLDRRADALEAIATGRFSTLETVEAVAGVLEEVGGLDKQGSVGEPEAPPQPAVAAPAVPRQWLSLGLLLRLLASTFFMLQRPSRARVYSISAAVLLHVLEVSGLGLLLLSAVKGALLGGGVPNGLAEQALVLEAWVGRGCPVPPPGAQRGLLWEGLCVLQALVFSLAPR